MWTVYDHTLFFTLCEKEGPRLTHISLSLFSSLLFSPLLSSSLLSLIQPFVEICELTDILEGSIVRNIVQLEQACREVKNAARCIGDSILFKKMETAERIIKRDIVFSASLYVS
jgi:hypothetical protein